MKLLFFWMIKREMKPTYKNIMEELISLRKQRNEDSSEERTKNELPLDKTRCKENYSRSLSSKISLTSKYMIITIIIMILLKHLAKIIQKIAINCQ
jgi:hypothetical protein